MRELPGRRSEPGCTRKVTSPTECDRWMPPRFKMLEPRGSSLSFGPLQRSQNGEATMIRRVFHDPTTLRLQGFSPS
jgi:hypothetical protein